MAEFVRTLKQWLDSEVPVPAPVLLGCAGIVCLVLTCLAARKPWTWRWALVPGLLLSLLIEGWEIWEHYAPRGLGETSVVAIARRHVVDVLIFNVPAILIVTIARRRRGQSINDAR